MDKKQFEAKKAIIDKHRELIDALLRDIEKELAETQKPELRHGGTGKDHAGNFVLIDKGALWEKVYEKGTGIMSTALNKKGNNESLAKWAIDVTGNVFDHLKAIAEPLTEFSRCPGQDDEDGGEDDSPFKAYISEPHIWIEVENDGHYFDRADVDVIILGLQRLQYTERQKNDA